MSDMDRVGHMQRLVAAMRRDADPAGETIVAMLRDASMVLTAAGGGPLADRLEGAASILDTIMDEIEATPESVSNGRKRELGECADCPTPRGCVIAGRCDPPDTTPVVDGPLSEREQSLAAMGIEVWRVRNNHCPACSEDRNAVCARCDPRGPRPESPPKMDVPRDVIGALLDAEYELRDLEEIDSPRRLDDNYSIDVEEAHAARDKAIEALTAWWRTTESAPKVEFQGIEDLLRAASKVSVPEDLADDPRLKSYGAQFATMLLGRVE